MAALSLTATAGDKDKSYYPTKGYRGSFDFAWGNNFKTFMNRSKKKVTTYESYQFSTTHGYQIMPELYTGVGFYLIIEKRLLAVALSTVIF